MKALHTNPSNKYFSHLKQLATLFSLSVLLVTLSPHQALATSVLSPRDYETLKEEGQVESEQVFNTERGAFVLVTLKNGDTAILQNESPSVWTSTIWRWVLIISGALLLFGGLLFVINKELERKDDGFTLIELLVVIAIIGVLAGIVLVSLNRARIQGREAVRVSDIRALQTAIELYHNNNGIYPKTFEPGGGVVRRRYCDGQGDYIPNVVPTYIAQLPSDPALNCAGVPHSWSYASDGIDYKLITHPEQGSYAPAIFNDPEEDNGSDPCAVDGPAIGHIGVWTEGAKCWAM